MMPIPDPVLPGQESVWDYPRPPRLEVEAATLKIVHRGITIAATTSGFRTLETSHPPTYYFPPDDIAAGVLQPSAQRGSLCEWKGRALYWDVVLGSERLAGVGWSYPQPTKAFAALKDFVAFYAAPFEAAYVGEERVTPQPGGFYGGWISSKVAGPFKGVPGSQFW